MMKNDMIANIYKLAPNGPHFKQILLNDNFWISNKTSLKYIPEYPIDDQSGLVQIDELVQERRNSIANALESRLFCTNP